MFSLSEQIVIVGFVNVDHCRSRHYVVFLDIITKQFFLFGTAGVFFCLGDDSDAVSLLKNI